MAIELTDDGTLDTVLCCTDCGEEMRYNYMPGPDEDEHRDLLCFVLREKHPKASKAKIEQMADEALYQQYVDSCIEDAESEHECEPAEDDEPSEPSEGDITTEDHLVFYQDGRQVLARNTGPAYGELGERWSFRVLSGRAGPWADLGEYGDNHVAALRAYMAATNYFPNCWFISDHGNAHLMDLGA